MGQTKHQDGDGASKGFKPKAVKNQVYFCQVDGCTTKLSNCKSYCVRYRVCQLHLSASSVLLNGVDCRFCQQCGRFHELAEFDGNKRSCRTRLAHHNNIRQQRRKEAAAAHLLANTLFDLPRSSRPSAARTPGTFGFLAEPASPDHGAAHAKPKSGSSSSSRSSPQQPQQKQPTQQSGQGVSVTSVARAVTATAPAGQTSSPLRPPAKQSVQHFWNKDPAVDPEPQQLRLPPGTTWPQQQQAPPTEQQQLQPPSYVHQARSPHNLLSTLPHGLLAGAQHGGNRSSNGINRDSAAFSSFHSASAAQAGPSSSSSPHREHVAQGSFSSAGSAHTSSTWHRGSNPAVTAVTLSVPMDVTLSADPAALQPSSNSASGTGFAASNSSSPSTGGYTPAQQQQQQPQQQQLAATSQGPQACSSTPPSAGAAAGAEAAGTAAAPDASREQRWFWPQATCLPDATAGGAPFNGSAAAAAVTAAGGGPADMSSCAPRTQGAFAAAAGHHYVSMQQQQQQHTGNMTGHGLVSPQMPTDRQLEASGAAAAAAPAAAAAAALHRPQAQMSPLFASQVGTFEARAAGAPPGSTAHGSNSSRGYMQSQSWMSANSGSTWQQQQQLLQPPATSHWHCPCSDCKLLLQQRQQQGSAGGMHAAWQQQQLQQGHVNAGSAGAGVAHGSHGSASGPHHVQAGGHTNGHASNRPVWMMPELTGGSSNHMVMLAASNHAAPSHRVESVSHSSHHTTQTSVMGNASAAAAAHHAAAPDSLMLAATAYPESVPAGRTMHLYPHQQLLQQQRGSSSSQPEPWTCGVRSVSAGGKRVTFTLPLGSMAPPGPDSSTSSGAAAVAAGSSQQQLSLDMHAGAVPAAHAAAVGNGETWCQQQFLHQTGRGAFSAAAAVAGHQVAGVALGSTQGLAAAAAPAPAPATYPMQHQLAPTTVSVSLPAGADGPGSTHSSTGLGFHTAAGGGAGGAGAAGLTSPGQLSGVMGLLGPRLPSYPSSGLTRHLSLPSQGEPAAAAAGTTARRDGGAMTDLLPGTPSANMQVPAAAAHMQELEFDFRGRWSNSSGLQLPHAVPKPLDLHRWKSSPATAGDLLQLDHDSEVAAAVVAAAAAAGGNSSGAARGSSVLSWRDLPADGLLARISSSGQQLAANDGCRMPVLGPGCLAYGPAEDARSSLTRNHTPMTQQQHQHQQNQHQQHQWLSQQMAPDSNNRSNQQMRQCLPIPQSKAHSQSDAAGAAAASAARRPSAPGSGADQVLLAARAAEDVSLADRADRSTDRQALHQGTVPSWYLQKLSEAAVAVIEAPSAGNSGQGNLHLQHVGGATARGMADGGCAGAGAGGAVPGQMQLPAHAGYQLPSVSAAAAAPAAAAFAARSPANQPLGDALMSAGSEVLSPREKCLAVPGTAAAAASGGGRACSTAGLPYAGGRALEHSGSSTPGGLPALEPSLTWRMTAAPAALGQGAEPGGTTGPTATTTGTGANNNSPAAGQLRAPFSQQQNQSQQLHLWQHQHQHQAAPIAGRQGVWGQSVRAAMAPAAGAATVFGTSNVIPAAAAACTPAADAGFEDFDEFEYGMDGCGTVEAAADVQHLMDWASDGADMLDLFMDPQ